MRTALCGVALAGLLAGIPAVAEPTIYPVSFPTDSIALHRADLETIHGIAAMMERDTTLKATVIGKADTMGAGAYNERLSERRAEIVYNTLVKTYKVPADRVDVQWTGEKQPVVGTADNTAELQNRVVEVFLR
jgi:OOP family OmpA-OmpF porin